MTDSLAKKGALTSFMCCVNHFTALNTVSNFGPREATPKMAGKTCPRTKQTCKRTEFSANQVFDSNKSRTRVVTFLTEHSHFRKHLLILCLAHGNPNPDRTWNVQNTLFFIVRCYSNNIEGSFESSSQVMKKSPTQAGKSQTS